MAGIKTILQQAAEKKFNDNLTQVVKIIVESLEKLWDVGEADAIITIQASRFPTHKKKKTILNFFENQKGT